MEDTSRISSVVLSSGIFSERNSSADVDASVFGDDTYQAERTTPVQNRVPELSWYMRLLSEGNEAWSNVRVLWNKQDCGSKLCAILSFVSIPARVLKRAASPQNNTTIPDHASVCYLFVLMCYTLVFNLVKFKESDTLRGLFAVSCMVVAIVAMLYIYLFTKSRVSHDPWHDAPMRIFFRGGLYIFGFATIMNSICLAVDDWNCHSSAFDNKREATVQVVKALFVVLETLFLGYFHNSCFQFDTPFLQLSLAHILGTNLMLWFWTLCKEQETQYAKNCTSAALPHWDRYQKYFYPVFVEYLILALAILYGLWANFGLSEEMLRRSCMNCPRCMQCRQNQGRPEQCSNETTSFRHRYVPRCGIGITLGTVYVAIFLVVMLLAITEANSKSGTDTSNSNAGADNNYDIHEKFKLYCYVSIVMYLSMIFACYIIMASLRSPNYIQRFRSVDYDDVLLYISLMGILLLEGFHVTSKLINRRGYSYLVAVDVCATFQHLSQAVTLMSLSHYRGATCRRINRIWICECILFLLLTNLAWWIEDSFYLEPILARPGEIETIRGIKKYGSIVKPMVIFFRFHSATYFYNAWTIYRV